MQKNIGKKRVFIYLVNAILPLLIGLVYYILRRPDTRITQMIALFAGFQTETPLIPGSCPFLLMLDNYLADALWAYAFTFSIHTPALFAPRLETRVFFLCLFGACLVEFLQLIPSFGGVFDWIDIAVQLSAVMIAKGLMILIKKEFLKCHRTTAANPPLKK